MLTIQSLSQNTIYELTVSITKPFTYQYFRGKFISKKPMISISLQRRLQESSVLKDVDTFMLNSKEIHCGMYFISLNDKQGSYVRM